jgi:hypothetical protein
MTREPSFDEVVQERHDESWADIQPLEHLKESVRVWGIRLEGSRMTFLEQREVATRAISIAARRLGVDVSDALERRDRECVQARWAAWLALLAGGWTYERIANVFGVDHTSVVWAKRRVNPDLVEHIEAVQRELGLGGDQV